MKRFLIFLFIILVLSYTSLVLANTFEIEADLLQTGNFIPYGVWVNGLNFHFDKAKYSTLVVPDNPWLFSRRTYSLTSATENWALTYRRDYHLEAVLTQDFAQLTQALALKHELPYFSGPLGLDYSELSLNALDLSVSHSGEQLRVWVTGSIIAPSNTTWILTAGKGFIPENSDEACYYLQYEYGKATDGLGWALGGGLTYQHASHQVSLEVTDILGAIYWNSAIVEHGVVNTNSKVTDDDGHVTHTPIYTGTINVGNHTSSLYPRIGLNYQYGKNAPQYRLGVIWEPGWDAHWYYKTFFAPNFTLQVGIHSPSGSITVGTQWSQVTLQLTTDTLNLSRAKSIGLKVGIMLVL